MIHRFNLMAMSAVGALVLGAATPATALTVYFGENLTPNFQVTGAPVIARNAFHAALTGVGTETFVSYLSNTQIQTLTFAGSSGDIMGTVGLGFTGNGGGVYARYFGSFGTYPTSGVTLAEAREDFSITFDTPIAAFGFYATDIGDFASQLGVTLRRPGGADTVLTIPHTVSARGVNSDSLLFWGVIDQANPFTSIGFSHSNAEDLFGFDDLIIGDVGQVVDPGSGTAVPEPTTWALMMVGIGVAGAMLRRRRSLAMA